MVFDLHSTGFLLLVQTCAPNVAPVTLQAIVAVESAGNSLAININKGRAKLSHQPTTRAHAVHVAKELHALGLNFDVGLGQINSVNVLAFGLTWEQAFDPCINVESMGRVLTRSYVAATQSKSVKASGGDYVGAALSAYNTGSFTAGYANGYVYKVSTAAKKGKL